MKGKILILGKGFIGQRLQEALRCDISGERIFNFGDAQRQIKRYNPQIIINCIGHTGSENIDGCERDKDKTLLANVFVPIILAEAALRNGLKLVHISSGCIYHYDYSRMRPLDEKRIPDFFDLFYSRSKIYAERALSVLCGSFNILIVRIRIPLDSRPHPKNILTKLLKYKRVIDIPNSISYIPDFIQALQHLLCIDAQGIYNVVNNGALRYPQLLEAYRKYIPDLQYEVIDYKDLHLVRTNLVLSPQKLEKSGFKMRHIRDVLKECLREYLQGEK